MTAGAPGAGKPEMVSLGRGPPRPGLAAAAWSYLTAATGGIGRQTRAKIPAPKRWCRARMDAMSDDPAPRLRTASVGTVDMLSWLAEAGLACPPLAGMEQQIHTHGSRRWGTRVDYDERRLYLFDVEMIVNWAAEAEPFFALNHDGHGVNSYGLSLAVRVGPLVAFVQHLFGGLYTEPVASRVAIASTYACLAAWRPQPGRRLARRGGC